MPQADEQCEKDAQWVEGRLQVVAKVLGISQIVAGAVMMIAQPEQQGHRANKKRQRVARAGVQTEGTFLEPAAVVISGRWRG